MIDCRAGEFFSTLFKTDSGTCTHLIIILNAIEDYNKNEKGLEKATAFFKLLSDQMKKLSSNANKGLDGWPVAMEKALERLDELISKTGVDLVIKGVEEVGPEKALQSLARFSYLPANLQAIKNVLEEFNVLQVLSLDDVSENLGQLSKHFNLVTKVASLDMEPFRVVLPDLVNKVASWLGKVQEALSVNIDTVNVGLSDWKSALDKFRPASLELHGHVCDLDFISELKLRLYSIQYT